MSNFYLLLYVPILVLAVLCLRGTVKLFRNRHREARETFRIGGALLAVTLFTVSYAVMVVTHAHSFKIALLLIICMGIVNLLRTGFPRPKA